MSWASTTAAAAADPGTIAVVGAVAATYVAVWLYLLFKLADRGIGLLVDYTRARLDRARSLRKVPRLGTLLWAGETVASVSLALCIALPAVFMLVFVAPVLVTVGALDLAASLVTIGP